MVIHLHVHTEYSMLDGLARLEPLVERASDLGMKSLAITDHGGLYGAIDFYRLAKNSGVKPIIGCEMYVASGSRFERDSSSKIHHLTVLAKDIVGYRNLVKLVTASHLEGYYKRPRVDRDILEKYSEGLAVLSGCPSGEVPWLISQGRQEEALESVNWYKDVFETYYLEIMQHGGVPDLPNINKGLVDLGKRAEIPLVATNDSHYVLESHAVTHDVLLCIQTNTNVNDLKRMKFEEPSYHLRSHEEMLQIFNEMPDAVRNTETIGEMCNLDLDFSQARLPEFPVPDGLTSNEFLKKICWEGFEHLLPAAPDEYKSRLLYELEVIKQTRFPDYFLVVWDIAKFVRRNDIFFTVRGSAAASLVLYCLGVTDVDPMPFKLVFERFLNLERKEMPDIDMDFQDDRRQEVINYCAAHYGREHVAHIITFGTFGARASVRDAGRALGMTLENVDRVARMIPEKLNINIDESLEQSEDLKKVYDSDPETTKLVDTAKQIEGVTRHKSLHAAGVVISKEPLDEVVPLEFTSRGDSDGAVMTQYSMDPIAALGLLKMDFLGLVNLTVLADALQLVGENHGVTLKLTDIPLDDQETFKLLSEGETVGVFQLESAGMTRHIKELKPTSLTDVAAMIALFRPGPMEHINTFIDAKHGRQEVSYIHPALEEILEETYGVIVYQDQVLHIAREFAGYSLGEADIVRKAMGKKVPAIMAEEKGKFIEGALGRGYDRQLAESVFNLIEPFAGYAFNKAHSVSYGLVSYWTAYLKANYPAEYMTSFLNSYIDKKDRLISAIADCRRIGISVLPPSINFSHPEFRIETDEDSQVSIRFGLAAVKNVGTEALSSLVKSRNVHGHFSSLEDLCKNGSLGTLNRKAIESLIISGSFDGFGDRTGILEVSDRISALAQEELNLQGSNQSSMFEMMGEASNYSLAKIEIPDMSTTDRQKRIWEVEIMGVSVSSSNHLAKIMARVPQGILVMTNQLLALGRGERSTLAGQVSTVVDRFTRDDRPFKIVTLEMLDGSVEAVVWEDALEKCGDIWDPGRLLKITGNIREREGETTVSVLDAAELNLEEVLADTLVGKDSPKDVDLIPKMQSRTEAVPANGAESTQSSEILNSQELSEDVTNLRKKLVLFMKETHDASKNQMMLDDVKRLLLGSAGGDDVGLEIEVDSSIVVMDWQPVKVDATEELQRRLREVLGDSGDVSVQGQMF